MARPLGTGGNVQIVQQPLRQRISLGYRPCARGARCGTDDHLADTRDVEARERQPQHGGLDRDRRHPLHAVLRLANRRTSLAAIRSPTSAASQESRHA